MNLRTLLVHLDGTARCTTRIELAARVAAAQGARVVGLAATGLLHNLAPLYGYAPAGFVTEAAQALKTRAQTFAASFETEARRLGIASFEARVAEGDPLDAMLLHARYADLIVVGQADRDAPDDMVPRSFVEDVVVNAGRPVLIVPYVGNYPEIGKRVVAAWDGSREAARAFTDALPILTAAHKVHVLVFNADERAGRHGALPGSDVGNWLVRHGVPVEVSDERVDIEIASALLSRAADLSADLLVMGGYGHSRFRESIVGGVTRSILEGMTVPVLMSH